MNTGLETVRKYFPAVQRVEDADGSIHVDVESIDLKKAKRLQHDGCAMAQAICRTQHAAGAGSSSELVTDVRPFLELLAELEKGGAS